MNYHEAWPALLRTALLGTERQPPAPWSGGDPLGSTLAALDISDGEAALLGASASLTLYGRCGQEAARGTGEPPAPCPADPQPVVSPLSGRHLAYLLQTSTLLREWLEAAAAVGLRANDENLPELLDMGRRQSNLSGLVMPVLGLRGRWLAGLNPAWDYAASTPASTPGESWESGTKAARLDLLATMLRTERAAARELLLSTWAQEVVSEKVKFLRCFEPGLEQEDEAWLEARLEDRAAEVRAAVARLLASLPESRLQERMFQRLRRLLAWQPGWLLKKPALEAALPEVCDEAMLRDGMDPTPPNSKIGERAWWLRQMIEMINPVRWEQEWKVPPPAIVQAAQAGEWRELLVPGLRQAALRHGEGRWLEAFLEVFAENLEGDDVGWLGNLPAELAQREAARIIKGHGGRLQGPSLPPLSRLLLGCAAWDEPTSREVLAAMRTDCAEVMTRQCDDSGPLYPRAGALMPPSLWREAAEGWPVEADHWTIWRGYVQPMLQTLKFRHEMLRELGLVIN